MSSFNVSTTTALLDYSRATVVPPFPYLYRVLREDELNADFRGLFAKVPHALVSVFDHVNPLGPRPPSQYISTSASLGAAIAFAQNSWYYSDGSHVKIARIDTSRIINPVKFIDLSDADTRLHYFPVPDGEWPGFAHNCARKFEEVLVIGTIPGWAVTIL